MKEYLLKYKKNGSDVGMPFTFLGIKAADISNNIERLDIVIHVGTNRISKENYDLLKERHGNVLNHFFKNGEMAWVSGHGPED